MRSLAQKFFILYLGMREQAWQIRVLPELYQNPNRFTICVVPSSVRSALVSTTPPLLWIEFLEPGQSVSIVTAYREQYKALQINTLWVVDAATQRVYQTPDIDFTLKEVKELTVHGTDIWVSKDQAFEEYNSETRVGDRASNGHQTWS